MIARDVTAAMLVIKNKNVSLLLKLNTTFMKILQKIVHCINHQTLLPCHVTANQEEVLIKRGQF